MASKKFCDFCGKEIQGERDNFTLDIFDGDKAVLEKDVCRPCVRRVKRALEFLIKKN